MSVINRIQVNGVDYEVEDSNALKEVPSEYKTKAENDELYQAKGQYLTEETDPTVPSYVKNISENDIASWDNKSEFSGDYDDLTNKPDLSQFITNTVNNLTNYYLKSETYTKDEVTALIGAIQQFHYEIVQELPQTGANNILYLVPKADEQTQNVYDEYVYANNTWEKIGDTEIDLSNYVTTDDLNTALENYVTKAELVDTVVIYYSSSPRSDEELKSRCKKIVDNWFNNIPTNIIYFRKTGSSLDYVSVNLNITYSSSSSLTLEELTGFTTVTSGDNTRQTQYKKVQVGLYFNSTSHEITDISYSSASLPFVFDNKQDKLTAGDNITIDSNNVISASGEKSYTLEFKDYSDKNKQIAKDFLEDCLNSGELKKLYLDVTNKVYVQIQMNTKKVDVFFTSGLTPQSTQLSFESLLINTGYGFASSDDKIFTQLRGAIYFSVTEENGVYSVTLTGNELFFTNENRGLPSSSAAVAKYTGTAYQQSVLAVRNTTAFTPTTGSYNPATAKYAEDQAEAVRVQYSTMPTAGAENLGKIVQYTGADTQDYTQGHFYVCVSDGQTVPTYSWQEISFGGEDSSVIFTTNELMPSATTEVQEKVGNLIDKMANNEPIPQIILKNLQTNIFYVLTNYTVTTASSYKAATLYFVALQQDSYSGALQYNSKKYEWTKYSNNSIFINGGYTDVSKHNLLSFDNTTSFTPTGNYNPATKKYVDDQVGAINTILATLTTPTQGGN